ncbi:MAG: acyl-CoA dehydratase activase [Vulcanimicrobiota bacterium]
MKNKQKNQGLAFAGIDIGSRSIELTLLEADTVIEQRIAPTTFDPVSQCKKLLEGIGFRAIVATGYGRELFAENFSELKPHTFTEIKAYALGAGFLYPEVRAVLDIGGQDTKTIALSETGKVTKFEMNDRCAAGTGKFLEFMANSFQISVEDFGKLGMAGRDEIIISNVCTVFAESEVISLMARGEKPENIALGVHKSIIGRTLAMLSRVGVEFPLLFAGGVARNPCMRKLLKKEISGKIIFPEKPEFVGSIGAAISGRMIEKEEKFAQEGP